MSIKVVLWDIDGTLLDFLAAEKAAIKKCFELLNLGICTDDMVERYSTINVKYWQMLERGEMTKPQILVGRFAEFFREIGIDEKHAVAFNDLYQVRLGDTIVFYPNALETLKKLQGKVLQCAVTNGTKIAQTRKLHESGMDKIFDCIFISEEIGIEKPNKGFFEHIFMKLAADGRCVVDECETAATATAATAAATTATVTVATNNNSITDRVSLKEIMIVGDSLTSDMRGGNNAGIVTCRFNPGGLPDNQEIHVDYDITDISQVLDIIDYS